MGDGPVAAYVVVRHGKFSMEKDAFLDVYLPSRLVVGRLKLKYSLGKSITPEMLLNDVARDAYNAISMTSSSFGPLKPLIKDQPAFKAASAALTLRHKEFTQARELFWDGQPLPVLENAEEINDFLRRLVRMQPQLGFVGSEDRIAELEAQVAELQLQVKENDKTIKRLVNQALLVDFNF